MKYTKCAVITNISADTVIVETNFTNGLPKFHIVGLPSSEIQESKERIKSAILSSGFRFPQKVVTVNLSPSDIRKSGSHFDLSIALLIVLFHEDIDLSEWYIFGELGLDGYIRDTRDIFPAVLSLKREGSISKVIVPKESVNKLSKIEGIEIFPVESLQEAIDFLKGIIEIEPAQTKMFDSDEVESIDGVYFFKRNFGLDFKDIRGQKIALRAALIAAAGMHNIIFEGSPGSGKTMIARRMRYILPPLTLDEVLDIAQIEAINNSSPTFEPVRPFRAPHHSASRAAIFGSGTKNQIYIGEVTLAHHGILFFDELPHFPKNILEALREPLQDREIHISRVHIKTNNPADFVFVGAQNPCPCGNLFSKNRECRCSDIELTRYRNKISDPFWDRIDLYVAMQEVDLSETPSTSSAEMFEKVLKAFEFQRKRGQKDFNGKLTDGDVEKYIRFEPELEEILNTGISRFGLSFRSANKIKKVARTIADIEGREEILKRDILEAFSYRKRY